MPTVLLIEDEPGIADTVQYALEAHGIRCQWVNLGMVALEVLSNQAIDVVILDVGLPDIDGFEVCRRIRRDNEVPIIFLTARQDEIDRVVGLELGADDYVLKPFSPRELVARVKARLRREHIREPVGSNVVPRQMGYFMLDEPGKRIAFCGQWMALTAYEFGILYLMMQHPGRVYSREQLLSQVWQNPEQAFDRAVDTHIKTLRGKLREVNAGIEPLKTHRGLGYSLLPEVVSDSVEVSW